MSRSLGRPPRVFDPVSEARRERLARIAIDWPRSTLQAMAEELGVSRSALVAYRSGARRLPPEVSRALVVWLRGRALEAAEIADLLEDLGGTV
jgi:hypothetical protein